MYFVSLLLLVLVSINYIHCEAGPLEYVSHLRSFEGARKYCRMVYGTELASIQNEICKNDATTAINEASGDSAWFGLYSNSESGNWRFLNGDECTADSAFKCIDLWSFKLKESTANRPRCIGESEGGTQCAIFDVNTGIDNNIDCSTPKPFFCEPAQSEPSYNPGEYVFIDGGEFEEGLSFEEAQGQCQRKYGTDLATIVTEADALALSQLLADSVTNSFPFAWIGLNDIRVEGMYISPYLEADYMSILLKPFTGQFRWIDGTDCTDNDEGRCVDDLFDYHYYNRYDYNGVPGVADNIGDIDGLSNADCIVFNGVNVGPLADGSNFFEANCDNPAGIDYNIACNAPQTTSYNPGNYVFIPGPAAFGDANAFSFDEAQAECESVYGTDLATIVTEADAVAAHQVLVASVTNGWFVAWIGLNDIGVEGEFEWIDGTDCTENNEGRCVENLFDYHYYNDPNLFDTNGVPGVADNIGDIDGLSNADCIVFNGFNNGPDAAFDGSNFFENNCENPGNIEHNILCNAPST